jgi:hypothetical protein
MSLILITVVLRIYLAVFVCLDISGMMLMEKSEHEIENDDVQGSPRPVAAAKSGLGLTPRALAPCQLQPIAPLISPVVPCILLRMQLSLPKSA